MNMTKQIAVAVALLGVAAVGYWYGVPLPGSATDNGDPPAGQR